VKKDFLVLMLVMVVMLAFSAVAHAANRNFDGWFTLDVPNGWKAEQDDLFVQITSPNGSEVITFEYASAEGMDPYQFAESSSSKLGGNSPVVETDRGDFEFVFTNNGVKTNARAFMIESVGIVMRSHGGFDNLYSILDTFGK